MGSEEHVLEVIFDQERETKNTFRFEERAGENPPVVGTLYIQKWALHRLGDPAVLHVRVEAGESGQAVAKNSLVTDS
jgi:hypothetical protein